jgi:perosamine synthetase
VPVDVRPDCLDFDPANLLTKITPRTRAVMVVPLRSYPIDLTETRAILTVAGVPLIEDAAHAHGAKIGGNAVGTLGAIGCFSTHDRKLLATFEGGFMLTDSPALAELGRAYSRLGNLSGKLAGVNFKFNALGAALGLARMPFPGGPDRNAHRYCRRYQEPDSRPSTGCRTGFPYRWNPELLQSGPHTEARSERLGTQGAGRGQPCRSARGSDQVWL